MEFSYWARAGQPWSEILDGARWAEARGWYGVWVPDHFMGDAYPDDPRAEDGPVLEAWTLQAGLAALTSRIRIGAMVTGNTYRHPAVVANMACTVDHISDGRCVLGLGAGWQQNEHVQYGIELGSPAERSDRLEEACQVIRGLLDNDRFDFAGEYFTLTNALCKPKPVQKRLPLLVAGRGERRTLRSVARWADEWNAWGTPEDFLQLGAVLREHCADAGREPSEIRVTAAAMVSVCDDEAESAKRRETFAHRSGLVGTTDQIRAAIAGYAEAGVDELVIPDFNVPADRRDEILARLDDDVFAEFR